MKRLMLIATMFVCLSSGTFAQSYGDYAVTVDVSGNGFAHYTTVYFDDESWDPQNPPTFGWDACCDALMIWANTNQPHVFTEVVDPPLPPNNHRLSVNGMPHISQHTEVPLGFLPGQLAPYVFTFKELYTLPQGMGVELEDLSLNVTQDLLVDSTYDTWGAPSDDERRFTIHFYPETVTGINRSKEENVSITLNNEQIRLRAPAGTLIESVSVLSMSGSVVFDKKSIYQEEHVFSLGLQSKGIYVVSVHTTEGVATRRKISF